ncbi:3'(2'),5'-bisphosphate nucleotidase CysQ [Ectothiorhodospiraceae bacterium WFHF3C12]|nr:3'(2'),5'-bisphosphate nucleotidase CysQ [Ectothiorhodospiraceae bacterium WFHF3C12]
MNLEERKELLDPLCELARSAGERIMAVYQRDFEVDTKDDDSPLTEADRAAHEALVKGLRELTPGIPVLSEEGDQADFDTRRGWDNYWLVDPLDGTKEFIKKNGEFTVNIALIQGQRPIIGIVHAPALGTTYFAAKGKGAFRTKEGETESIHTRSLSEVEGPLVAVVSRSHRGEAVDTLLERLPEHETTSVGSSLKFCLVAEGKADLYPRFGPTSEWDTAAAQCVVETAGGKVCLVDLQPLPYNSKESLLNPDFLVFGDPAHDWSQYLEGFTVEWR